MNTTESANNLIESGLSVIPVKMPEKLPTVKSWQPYQTRRPTVGELTFNGGLAIVCGKVSGGLECLDVDIKYDVEGNLKEKLYDAMGQDLLDEIWPKLVIQETIKGGLHFIYRCEEVQGNLKLASRHTTSEELKEHPNEKAKVLLETRGEGGYFIAHPTPGYKILQGDLSEIQTITPQQRSRLMSAARSINQVYDLVHVPTSAKIKNAAGGTPPWEDFDQKTDMRDILTEHGWKFIKAHGKNELWKRPGSTDSKWSGSFNSELNLFYCFSSSVLGLEASKAYTPSALVTHLDYQGNFEASARELYHKGFGDRHQHQDLPPPANNGAQHSLEMNIPATKLLDGTPPSHQEERSVRGKLPVLNVEQLKTMWYDLIIKKEPPPEVIHLSIQGVPVATAGNHSLIIGKKKSRKSLFLVWLLSQFKGIHSEDIIMFDTEQGKHHVWRMRQKLKAITGQDVPIFYLRGQPIQRRLEIIEMTLQHWAYRPKIIVIDGIRDLISNINDPDQTTDLIIWLESLIIRHGVHVINVLHINKTDNNARGHVGTELLNKAEITMELQKDEATGMSIVKCESSRERPFEDFAFTHGPDDLPIIIDGASTGNVMKDDEKIVLVKAAFKDGASLSYADAVEEIKAHFKLGRDKARQIIAEASRKGWLFKSGSGPKAVYSRPMSSAD